MSRKSRKYLWWSHILTKHQGKLLKRYWNRTPIWVLYLTFRIFSEQLFCRGPTKSVLNYVPYVFYMLMCLTCLRGFVLLPLTCLSFFTCFLWHHFFTCLTSLPFLRALCVFIFLFLHFLRAFIFLHALHAFIFTCLTCLACLQFSRTLCSFFYAPSHFLSISNCQRTCFTYLHLFL